MFLDIGVGILSALFTSSLFDVELGFGLILFSLIFSLLPDVDTVFHIRKEHGIDSHKGHNHRDLWHYPLLYIPIGTLIIGYFSQTYGFLFALTSFSHFFHDSIGIGWGIQWLYPFSRKHFSFFYHYDVYRNNLPKKWIYGWTHKEVDEMSEKYGDKNWIRNIYLKWHPYAIVEFLVFVVSLIAFYLKSGIQILP